jgi:ArsR family transcriptional regulator
VQVDNKERLNILPKTKAELDYSTDFFKAMSHPTRIVLVLELAQGEHCVRGLTEKVGADMSTVSRHLRELKNAGIIASEKRGNQVFYRLRTPCILNFLKCIRNLQTSGS